MRNFDLYLASASPRRRELLHQMGVRFERIAAEIHEGARGSEGPRQFVQRLALEKARAGAADRESGDERPVLGADTIVVIDDDVLGKPHDRTEGQQMLARLSARTHRVLSAVAVVTDTELVSCSESSVTFRALTEQERCAYWETGEPADKAGAYAIQGQGAVFVSRLEGSYSGVMGLPIFETAELLRTAGIDVLSDKG